MKRRDAVSRRQFLIGSSAAATLNVSLVEMALGSAARDFTFAFISDAHLQQLRGRQFVPQWDGNLARAIAEANRLRPRPDFIFFGGDLAQLGTPAELEHGADLLARLASPVRMVIGEHDYYLDCGEYWSKLFGPQTYSFDHKGVHFVVLNSILADAAWLERWPHGVERMARMAGLENPEGSPFRVGEAQRRWLARDLASVPTTTPLVVVSHAPLQKMHRDWNFWTEDAAEVQELLAPFAIAAVLNGHVHRPQLSRIGNTTFYSVAACCWPWPQAPGGAASGVLIPKLTLPRDVTSPGGGETTGLHLIDVHSGRLTLSYP